MSPRSKPPAPLALLGGLLLIQGSATAQDEPSVPATTQDESLEERVARLEDELEALRGGKGFRIGEHFTGDFYGYVKLDAAYDQAESSIGKFARWVETEGLDANDSQFSLTARQTRLGLIIEHPAEDGVEAYVRFEIDFYGQGSRENKAEVLLRHAYADLEWPNGWSLLFGQTCDVISPLWLPTVNYTAGWWQGNIGFRRGQVRVTKLTELGEVSQLVYALAVTATISERQTPFAPSVGDTGQDSGIPTVQSRVGWSFPLLTEDATTLGLSGHYGTEEYELDPTGDEDDFSTWSLCLDVDVPLTERTRLQAEAYTGDNVDTYLGGIAQGFDPVLQDTVAAAGGWVAATIKARDDLDVHVGYAIDTADEDDLSAADARTMNQVVFANAYKHFGDHFQVAFELSYLETEYQDLASGNSVRAQLALIYGI